LALRDLKRLSGTHNASLIVKLLKEDSQDQHQSVDPPFDG